MWGSPGALREAELDILPGFVGNNFKDKVPSPSLSPDASSITALAYSSMRPITQFEISTINTREAYRPWLKPTRPDLQQAIVASPPSGSDGAARAPASATPAAAPGAALAEAVAATSEEQHELKELHDLFGGARGSPVPASLYARYRTSLDNIGKAKQARREKEARDAQREQQVCTAIVAVQPLLV